MANETVLLNGVDCYALGFKIERVKGLLHGAESKLALGWMPGRSGSELLSAFALSEHQPRLIVLSGVIDGTSAADLIAKADALKNYLYQKALTVTTAHDLTREIVAYCTGCESDAFNPSFVARTAPTTVTLSAPDPLWRATTDTTTPFTSNTSIPIGTARSRPRIVVTATGTVTGFTITLKDSAGVTVATMVIGNGGTALSLGSTHTFTIDSDLMRLTKNVGAGEVDGSAHHVSGAFPLLDPQYVALSGPTYMSLSIGSVTGGGSAAASAIYRKTYY